MDVCGSCALFSVKWSMEKVDVCRGRLRQGGFEWESCGCRMGFNIYVLSTSSSFFRYFPFVLFIAHFISSLSVLSSVLSSAVDGRFFLALRLLLKLHRWQRINHSNVAFQVILEDCA